MAKGAVTLITPVAYRAGQSGTTGSALPIRLSSIQQAEPKAETELRMKRSGRNATTVASGRSRTRSRGLVVVAIFSALAMLVAGCGSSNSSSSASGGNKHVVFIVPSEANPWQKGFNTTVVKGLQDKGYQVSYLQDNFDPAVQVQHFQQAIAQKPALIAFLAADAKALVPSIAKAKAAGIPVIGLDGRSDPASIPDLTSQLLANHPELGKFAAMNIVQGLQQEGVKSGNVIAITGTASQPLVQDRMKDFNAYMAKYPQYKVVSIQDGGWDQTKTQGIASQLFAKYQGSGGIQAAYGMADQQAAGIIQAAQQANIPLGVAKKGLIVTGSNCLKIGIDNIKSGLQYGTGTQAPVEEGKFVLADLLKFLQTGSVPKLAYAPEYRITQANVNKYAAQCSTA
jgi:ABC-type sugar transport system substrate-binding protein